MGSSCCSLQIPVVVLLTEDDFKAEVSEKEETSSIAIEEPVLILPEVSLSSSNSSLSSLCTSSDDQKEAGGTFVEVETQTTAGSSLPQE